MQTESSSCSKAGSAESSKLVSLLALATGAVAMPQTSNADIVFSNMTSSPITVAYTGSPLFVIDSLPGTAQLAFQFGQIGSTSYTSTRFIVARQFAGAVKLRTMSFFVAPGTLGQVWGEVGTSSWQSGTVGWAKYFAHGGSAFSDKYYAFQFQDSLQGNALRYGWVHVSFVNGNVNATDGPELTIDGYAYDNTGAQIAMGAVPEPSSGALLALGALLLGSKGVRSWRRNRTTTGKC